MVTFRLRPTSDGIGCDSGTVTILRLLAALFLSPSQGKLDWQYDRRMARLVLRVRVRGVRCGDPESNSQMVVMPPPIHAPRASLGKSEPPSPFRYSPIACTFHQHAPAPLFWNAVRTKAIALFCCAQGDRTLLLPLAAAPATRLAACSRTHCTPPQLAFGPPARPPRSRRLRWCAALCAGCHAAPHCQTCCCPTTPRIRSCVGRARAIALPS